MPGAQGSIPPYVPYRTFRNFLEFLREEMPARIDRSVWGPRFSGSNGIQLMTALKSLELIDEGGRPTRELEKLVRLDGDERRATLAGILRRHYAPVFELDLSRATRAQFREKFRGFGAREGVLAKCEAFFIRAAQDAGIELSSYILAGRHGSQKGGGSTGGRASRGGRGRHAHAEAPARPPQDQPAAHAAAPAQHPSVAIAEMVLRKYPDFDPAWSPEVQQKWLEGMTRLWESLSMSAPSGTVRANGAAASEDVAEG